MTANAKLLIEDGYISFIRTDLLSNPNFRQIIEFPEKYHGLTLTASIEYRTTLDGYFRFASPGYSVPLPASHEWNIITRTFAPTSTFTGGNGSFCVENYALSQGKTVSIGDAIQIRRIKLELGEVSTLANDPPMDYGKELAVCQRYQIGHCGSWIRIRASAVTPNYIDFFVPTPVTLRVNPTTLASDAWRIFNIAQTEMTGFALTSANIAVNGVLIRCTKIAHGLTDAFLSLHPNLAISPLIFDANL